MKRQSYLDVLANVSPQAPLDLDALIFGAPVNHPDCPSQIAAFPPSAALWGAPDDRPSRIGIRVKAPLENTQLVVTRLAAIAIERQIFPIILSHSANNELQRFGFRVEKISGATETERNFFEDQIRRFWNLAIIVDADDIANFG